MDADYLIHKRLYRANLLTAQLENSFSSYITYAGNIKFKGSHSKGKRVVTYSTEFIHEPNYVEWGLLLGELAHCLRSTLDNVIFALSSAKTDGNEFPIFWDAATYNKSQQKKLEGISNQNILKYIESRQPYKSIKPRHHPLWLLHKINIDDKHRLPRLLLLKPILIQDEFVVHFKDKIYEPKISINKNPATDGEWLVKYRYPQPFQKFTGAPIIKLQGQIEIDGVFFSIKNLCNALTKEVFEITNYLSPQIPRHSL